MEVKKEYGKLREKHNLPSFEEINEEFEISGVEVEKVNSLSRAILRIICNKMVIFLNFIEPVVNPNPQGLHAFVEVENTTNEEKKRIFSFYKDLSYKYHKSYSLELLEDESAVIKEIKNILGYWKETKSEFKELCKMINQSWKREKEKENSENVG